jgi:hypothetical protein
VALQGVKDLLESQPQSFAAQYLEVVKTRAPSGEKSEELMEFEWPCKVFKHLLESHCRSFAVQSSEPVKTKAPSGETIAKLMQKVWPCKVLKDLP